MDPVQSACEALLDRCSGSVVVGLSGGLDSTVLLHGLAGAASGERLRAIHVNHHIHPDSDRWAEHCAGLAAALGVPLVTVDRHVLAGSNLEARARAARYAAYAEELGDGEVLVLAHHADDRLETRLLHLLQGRGLYGIPRDRTFADGRLLRPLLDLPRSSIEAYAESRGLHWLEDPGNADFALDRNFLRHQVVPALKARFARLDARLGRIEDHQAGLAEALEASLGLERDPLPLTVLHGLSKRARRAVLRRWLTLKVPAAGVSDAALEEYLVQLEAANDRQPALAVGTRSLRRFRQALYLVPAAPDLDPVYACEIPGCLRLPHGDLLLSNPAPGMAAKATAATGEAGRRAAAGTGTGPDADSGSAAALAAQSLVLFPPLSVTFVSRLQAPPRLEVGTRAAPFRRDLKAIFAEAGIPPWERGVWPLVVDRQGLAAVAGLAERRPEVADDVQDTGRVSVVLEWRRKVPDETI